MSTKPIFIGLLILVLSLGNSRPLSAESIQYVYNEKNSRVDFTLRHLGIITVQGHFKIFYGSFSFNPQKIEPSNVNISIQTGSVDSGFPIRDQHLRSKNFFDTADHPLITFVGKNFEAVTDTHFNIHGDLTIHGITRPVVFVTDMLPKPKGAPDTTHIFFHSETFIKRKDFHLGTGNLFDPILFLTDETLKISLEVEGIPTG